MNDIMMGTSLPYAERKRQGLMGRMPHKEESLAQQRRRIYRLVSAMQSPFDQHLLLRQLQEDNPVLFYELVRHHLPELLPIIYTTCGGRGVSAPQRPLSAQPRPLSLLARSGRAG